MKRLALAFGSLVLSAQILGCDGGSSTSGTVTGPKLTVPDSENTNLPAEVREEARKEEARIRKANEGAAKKP